MTRGPGPPPPPVSGCAPLPAGTSAQLEAIDRRAARAVLDRVGGSVPVTVDLDSSIFRGLWVSQGGGASRLQRRAWAPSAAGVHPRGAPADRRPAARRQPGFGRRGRALPAPAAQGDPRASPRSPAHGHRLLRPGRGALVRRTPARLQHLRQTHQPPAGRDRRAARARLAGLRLGDRRGVGRVPLPTPRLVARVPAAGAPRGTRRISASWASTSTPPRSPTSPAPAAA